MGPAARRETGFTLIELMIVVAVIAILAAIAYPNYQKHVHDTRRTDAKAALMGTAQRFERCYSSALAYDKGDCESVADGLGASPEGFYTLKVENLGATSYTLVATATGVQTADEDCRTFSLNQTGARSAAASDGSDTTATCW